MPTDRSQYEVSLMPEELAAVASDLSPTVQLINMPTLHPGGIRIPQWAAMVIIDGEVEGSIHTPCPIESYAAGCEVLVQTLQSREPDQGAGDIVGPGLFGGAS